MGLPSHFHIGLFSLVELRYLLKLAGPIFLAQVALASLGLVDTIMSGRVGVDDLAAIGLGSGLLMPVFMFGTGILLALTPLVSKAVVKGNYSYIAQLLVQGSWLALPIGGLSLAVLWHVNPILDLLSLTPSVYQLTEDYLFYVAFGLLGISLYQVLRFVWEGLGETLPTMYISITALLLNIPLNWIFIYGYGPIPPFGAVGCGIATSIVMWSMFLMGLLYVFYAPKFDSVRLAWQPQWLRWHEGLKPILALGVPITLALLFEVGMFSFIALFVAKLGTVVLAAHQVALSFTSIVFMIPLSLSMAITVRVGMAYGQQNLLQLKTRMITGVVFAAGVGMVASAMTYLFVNNIVAYYTQDSQVQVIAAGLLMFAVVYQTFDAIQVTLTGALRGLHDSKMAMVVAFICYWLIGLGLGWIVTFTAWLSPQPMGVAGFWLGIVLGLIVAAVLLFWHLIRLVKKHVLEGEWLV